MRAALRPKLLTRLFWMPPMSEVMAMTERCQ